MKTRIFATLVVTLLVAGIAHAQIPQTMHFQGSLSDSTGTPLNGQYTVDVSIYNQEMGGSPLWMETHVVDILDGLFSVTLGSINPLNLPFDEQYWLGVSIDGSNELDPRFALASSPYSLNSNSTLAELQPGQDLIVRDSMGNPTHTLESEGSASFTGKASFDGSADTGIVIRSLNGPALVVLIGDSINSAAFQSPSSDGKSESANGDEGITIKTSLGTAIRGEGGASGNGVQGDAYDGHGVQGTSESQSGVHGHSENGPGTSGHSTNDAGGDFYSDNGPGVRAFGEPAGEFYGDVDVRGEVFANSLHIVTRDVLGDIEDTLVNFFSDGTSEHMGLETYRGGIDVVGSNLNMKFNDASEPRVILNPAPSTSIPAISTTGPVQVGPGSSLPPAVTLNPFAMALTPAIKAIGHVKVQRDANDSDPPVMQLDPTTNPNIPSIKLDGRTEIKGDVGISGNLFSLSDPTNNPMFQAVMDSLKARLYAKLGIIDLSQNEIVVIDPNASGTDPVLDVNGPSEFKGSTTITNDIITPEVLFRFDSDLPPSGYHMKVKGRTSMVYDPTSIGTVLSVNKTNSPSRTDENGADSYQTALRQSLPPLRNPDGEEIQIDGDKALQLPVIQAFNDLSEGTSIQALNVNMTNTQSALEGINTGGGAGILGRVTNAVSAYPGVWAATTGQGAALLVDHSGSAGDLALLRDNDTNRVRIDKTGKGFFNGGTQTGGADIAEAFEVEGMTDHYEPGDVIVISQTSDRTVTKCHEAYSRLVVGVYATRPGVLLTERHIDDDLSDAIPVGVVGILPTKVTTENGPIRRGDLLVTSSTPGYAMRGTDGGRMLGATLGKALEEYDASEPGVIRVLVNAK